MTPVEELRDAARLMRERAEKATPGPWKSTDHYPHVVFQGGEENIVATNLAGDPLADGAHIAGWHPAVALAVAEMLDRAAVAWPVDHSEPPRNPRDRQMTYEALAVARAYLGEADRG